MTAPPSEEPIPAPRRWYLLIHQLPQEPLYLRAKIRRRLARAGAVALKNAVYVLPFREECLQDFQWIAREAIAGGGTAHVCSAQFPDSATEEALLERFRRERAADWTALARAIRRDIAKIRRGAGARPRGEDLPAALARARRGCEEVERIDFFEAPEGAAARELLAELAEMSRTPEASRREAGTAPELLGRTWATRRGVHVDRIASAWLIRRFVDPKARFRFIDPKEPPREGEIRFDIPGGDFSHEGDRCTFETLLERSGAGGDAALRSVAEIVHDIDLKNGKFGRAEARGVEQVLTGILLANPADEERLDRGFALFDELYESFRRKRFRKGGSKMRFWKDTSAALALSLALLAPAGAAQGPEGGWGPIDRVFGQAGKDLPGGVHKYGWPRNDLHVSLGGMPVEPALALGSWAGFQATGNGEEAVAMGDLVLTGPEVNAVVRELQANGLEVLALHNHLIDESPRVLYVHFHARGEATTIAKALKSALEKTKTPLAAAAPKTPPRLSAAEERAFATIQTVLGRKGSIAGRVLQIAVSRAEKITDSGMEVPPSMGVAISMNFEMAGGRAATTGDFVLTADEVNPVVRELQARGLSVTALHSHMLREAPRLFFLHFWGVGSPEKLAEGLKAALEKTSTRP